MSKFRLKSATYNYCEDSKGQFGITIDGYLMKNDGKGNFKTDFTEEELKNLGWDTWPEHFFVETLS